MIRGFIIGDTQTIAKLQNLFPTVRSELKRVIQALTFDLSAHVKKNKLSGQVLKTRTGTLRRSIHAQVNETDISVIGIVGTNIEYAHVHEYGGTFSIDEHLRLVKQAFGRELNFPVWSTVRTHQATYPKRSFLLSALRDKKPEIIQKIQAALDKTARGGLQP